MNSLQANESPFELDSKLKREVSAARETLIIQVEVVVGLVQASRIHCRDRSTKILIQCRYRIDKNRLFF